MFTANAPGTFALHIYLAIIRPHFSATGKLKVIVCGFSAAGVGFENTFVVLTHLGVVSEPQDLLTCVGLKVGGSPEGYFF